MEEASTATNGDGRQPPAVSSGLPSRGIPVTAVALDRRVDIKRAAERLRWPELRRYAYGSVYDPEETGRIYLFTFGAVVQEGVERPDESVLKVIQEAVDAEFLHKTTETYYVEVSPDRASISARVGWDQVVIPERSPELMAAVALLLGQSAALERYEQGANVLLAEALALSRQLERLGRPPRQLKTQLKRIGRLISHRLELTTMFYLLDQPEETWEDRKVAVLYQALFRNLELKDRHVAVLQKLSTVESATSVMIDSLDSAISIRLEAAIVVLIVVEILLALFKWI